MSPIQDRCPRCAQPYHGSAPCALLRAAAAYMPFEPPPPETVEELPPSVRVEALRAAAQVMATHEGNLLGLAEELALWIATGKRP